ncbi:MAG: class I SAM-dependent methyltransferase [Sulfuricella sp.]|nr:class I SAM-dependent methyltransferase [Sulfuricella sp.]
MSAFVDERFGPLLGESVWHTVTVDPTLQEVSDRHFYSVRDILMRHGQHLPSAPQILEVAAYAHTTGYVLAQRLEARSTLLDVSASTLKLGRQNARQQGLPLDRTRLIAADFHTLPFEDGQFHIVYICSALHHTWNWQQVLAELIRVLAPGGLLLLENEPCRREFCCYRFRTNRLNNFTPLETKLDQLGIVRTVAEPYLGSRPETLFGMVENQAIPLDELKRAVENSCRLLEFSVAPEVCMGSLEQEMLEHRTMDTDKLAVWLSSRLDGLLSQALPFLRETEKGLGFSLPEKNEVATLCNRAAELLTSLPVPPTPGFRQRAVALLLRLARVRRKLLRYLALFPLPAIRNRLTHVMSVPAALQNQVARAVSFTDDPYREGLAQLFGGSVKIVARKSGDTVGLPEGRLQASYQEKEGVVLGFEPDMLRLLGQCSSFFPDLQSSPEEDVRLIFPTEDWIIETSSPGKAIQGVLPEEWVEKSAERGIRTLISRSDMGRIQFHLLPGRSLILLRCHGAYRDQPYRILLLVRGQELARMDVHQSESFILAGIAEIGEPSSSGISLRMVALDGGSAPSCARVSLTYASAISL